MRIVFGTLALVHASAHLVGFVVPWRLSSRAAASYTTTVLGGHWDLGDAGIRVVGILWLLAAVAFGVAGLGALATQPWWHGAAWIAASFSLALCVLGWPAAWIGALLDVAILGFLAVWAMRTS